MMRDFLLFCRGKLLWMCQRVFILYFILISLFLLSVNYLDLASKGRGAALSRLMPDHTWVTLYLDRNGHVPNGYLNEFIHYYSQLVEYMPYTADAFGMLGFVHYHMGDKDKALAAYQRAIELNPLYFWFYYSKGLMHFENGEYAPALELFRSAMSTSPDTTLSFTYMSKIFLPIRDITEDYNGTINIRLKKAYRDCYALVLLSQYFLKDYRGVLNSANYALKENSEDKNFFCHYAGIAAYHLGEYQFSVSLLQQSLQGDPGNREGLEYLAAAWESLGRPDLAMPFKIEANRRDIKGSPFEMIKPKLSLQIF